MWRPSVAVRFGLAIVGLFGVVVGVAAWGFETEYGGEGGQGNEMEFLSDGTVRVFDSDERRVDDEGHPLRVVVFEGTREEADAWVAVHEGQGRNFTIPVLILGFGGILLIGAVLPSFGLGGQTESQGGDLL